MPWHKMLLWRDVNQQAVQILNNHFFPQSNEPFKTEKLMWLKPYKDEAVDSFITGLKEHAPCGFSNVDRKV